MKYMNSSKDMRCNRIDMIQRLLCLSQIDFVYRTPCTVYLFIEEIRRDEVPKGTGPLDLYNTQILICYIQQMGWVSAL